MEGGIDIGVARLPVGIVHGNNAIRNLYRVRRDAVAEENRVGAYGTGTGTKRTA